MKSEATHPCGMSPMKRGWRASRPTTSATGSLGRPPVVQEIIEQTAGRARRPAEAHERANNAQLVRRVRVPWFLAIAPVGELLPVALEGSLQQRRGSLSLLAAG